MSPRLAFSKRTPEGLSVEVESFGDVRLLLLAKTESGGFEKAVQVLGVAGREVNTPTLTWYYEYEPLPRDISWPKLQAWLEMRGCRVGTFDQFGNFHLKAA
jgi:hypothetical protein